MYVAAGSVVDSLVDSLDSVVVSLDSVVVSLVFSDSVVVSVVVTVSSGVTSDEFGVEDGCSLVDGVLQPAKRRVEAMDKTNNDFFIHVFRRKFLSIIFPICDYIKAN